MEGQIRRHRTVQIKDVENVYATKGKSNHSLIAKKQGLGGRGPLGDILNVPIQRDVNVGKVACATAEYEKKATLNRGNGAVKVNYSHVQSKVDTGRALKTTTIQSASATQLRLPLRREESTAALATRAVARVRAVLKEKPAENKESFKIYTQSKKTEKKATKLPGIKEDKEVQKLKPILKESTESLGKLKLAEEHTSIIDHAKLQSHAPCLHEILDTTPQLPDNIEDIDANDKCSPLLMSIYIKDIYKYLTELELKYPIHPDHLKYQSEITSKMRATLVDWLAEVQSQFHLELETFHMTIGIIDRYLQAVPNVRRNRLQLVGVTAMFIASKYEEIFAPDVADFVYVTDKAYSKAEMFQCERDIMAKLGFCLARPIPLNFLRRFLKASEATSKNHHLAKYFVDLCLMEYTMVHYRPSELAAAAICLSLYLLSSKKLEQVWNPMLTYYSGYTLQHLEPIIRKLAKVVTSIKESKCRSVYNNYCKNTVAKVATLPQLTSGAIVQLASS